MRLKTNQVYILILSNKHLEDKSADKIKFYLVFKKKQANCYHVSNNMNTE